MTMSADLEGTLMAIAEAIADGFEVDWEGLRQRTPQIAEQLEQMRTVAAVQGAYRAIREDEDGR